MFKFRLIAGRRDRLTNPAVDANDDVDTSRVDEMHIAEFREILDDSPTDEMEVVVPDDNNA